MYICGFCGALTRTKAGFDGLVFLTIADIAVPLNSIPKLITSVVFASILTDTGANRGSVPLLIS